MGPRTESGSPAGASSSPPRCGPARARSAWRPPTGDELLPPQDVALLCAQDADAPLQIGAVALFDADPLRRPDGSLRIDDLRRHVDQRLRDAPRFRSRLDSTPLATGPPRWIDDGTFDVRHHVHLLALPPPGDRAALRAMVARLIEQPLDDSLPLWEIWVIDGVEGGRVAIVPKVSHIMADGVALLDLALRLLDPSPAGDRAVGPPGAVPPPPPGPPPPVVRWARATAARLGRRAGTLGRATRTAVRHPGTALDGGVALLRAAAGARPAPPLAITHPVGRRRALAWLRVPMAELRAARGTTGATLNDVILAGVAGGLATFLPEARAGDVSTVRVLVPVSRHGSDPGHEVENRFSMLVADLPVGPADPFERLDLIHAEMEERKRSGAASVGSLLFTVADLVPDVVLRVVGPALLRHQPVANLAVSNLPGTPEPLSLLGSRLRELYPFITPTGNLACIVGAISYEEHLGIGVTVDAGAVPDVDDLGRALEASFAALFERSRLERSPIPPPEAVPPTVDAPDEEAASAPPCPRPAERHARTPRGRTATVRHG